MLRTGVDMIEVSRVEEAQLVVRASTPRLLEADANPVPSLVESYRRLADVFHELLAEQSLDALLVRIADVVGDLIPHDTLTIFEANETEEILKPVFVRDVYANEIMNTTIGFSEGITGWAVRNREPVLANHAHLDPRVRTVPGTPTDPEALICIPLIARDCIKGALNIYREGETVAFTEKEFEVASRFGDAAALALDNTEIRARLEHQARTDSLTGLFNHSVFYERLFEALPGGDGPGPARGQSHARPARRSHARHRRLQARERRARTCRRRRAPPLPRGRVACGRSTERRHLPARR